MPGSAVFGGKLYVFGGGNPFSGPDGRPGFGGPAAPFTTNSTQVYDPVANSWAAGRT